MTCTVAILHFTPPGVIGGVEQIIAQHARLLEQHGFRVQIVAGRKSPDGTPVHVIPEIDAARAESVAIETELALGIVSDQFREAEEAIRRGLESVIESSDVLLVHNAFTLHFSLPLTSVLWKLAEDAAFTRMIAWCHDLSWTNSLYIPAMHPGYPWELLRRPAPDTQYVTVSHERKRELLDLWGPDTREVAVVPNGLDVERFLRLSDDARSIVRRYQVLDRDAVILLPVRITRRKNIEAGIQAVAELKARGLSVLFLVSGPTAPHHPTRSHTYLDQLRDLASNLDVQREVVFLSDELGHNLTEELVSELYAVADILLFPSAQEGFGLPILEAGLARVPAVLSDIPIFHEVSGGAARSFAPDAPATTIADAIQAELDAPTSRLFRRVRQQYRWESIFDSGLLPLLPPADSSRLEAILD